MNLFVPIAMGSRLAIHVDVNVVIRSEMVIGSTMMRTNVCGVKVAAGSSTSSVRIL